MAGILTGIPNRGIDSTGGLEYALICTKNEVTVTIVAGVATITDSAGAVIDPATTPFAKFVPKKLTAGTANTWTGTPSTGAGFDVHALTMVFGICDTETREKMELLNKNELVAIAVDYNGKAMVLGDQRGLDVVSNAYGQGIASGDLNGFTVTMQADSSYLAPYLADGELDELIPA